MRHSVRYNFLYHENLEIVANKASEYGAVRVEKKEGANGFLLLFQINWKNERRLLSEIGLIEEPYRETSPLSNEEREFIVQEAAQLRSAESLSWELQRKVKSIKLLLKNENLYPSITPIIFEGKKYDEYLEEESYYIENDCEDQPPLNKNVFSYREVEYGLREYFDDFDVDVRLLRFLASIQVVSSAAISSLSNDDRWQSLDSLSPTDVISLIRLLCTYEEYEHGHRIAKLSGRFKLASQIQIASLRNPYCIYEELRNKNGLSRNWLYVRESVKSYIYSNILDVYAEKWRHLKSRVFDYYTPYCDFLLDSIPIPYGYSEGDPVIDALIHSQDFAKLESMANKGSNPLAAYLLMKESEYNYIRKEDNASKHRSMLDIERRYEHWKGVAGNFNLTEIEMQHHLNRAFSDFDIEYAKAVRENISRPEERRRFTF